MSTTNTILPEVTKRIAYNKETRDYDCFVAFDGADEQPIGSAGTYGDAEKKCNAYAFDYYTDNHTPEKAVPIALNGIPAPIEEAAAPTVLIEQTDRDTTFFCNEDVMLTFQDTPRIAELSAFGMAGLDFEDVVRDLPFVNAIFNDPCFQAARVRWEAGAPLARHCRPLLLLNFPPSPLSMATTTATTTPTVLPHSTCKRMTISTSSAGG